nr:MAG TPA: YopX protein [Caudoviricetes sp.]
MEDRYLFKAKELDDGEWVQGYYVKGLDAFENCEEAHIIFEPNTMFYSSGETDGWYKVDPTTICQCTGLKDKNGKLIWENDIMVAHLDDAYPEDETYLRVLWHEGGFCTKEKGSEEISPIDKFDQEHFEVIGNIFDNPELLGRNDK